MPAGEGEFHGNCFLICPFFVWLGEGIKGYWECIAGGEGKERGTGEITVFPSTPGLTLNFHSDCDESNYSSNTTGGNTSKMIIALFLAAISLYSFLLFENLLFLLKGIYNLVAC